MYCFNPIVFQILPTILDVLSSLILYSFQPIIFYIISYDITSFLWFTRFEHKNRSCYTYAKEQIFRQFDNICKRMLFQNLVTIFLVCEVFSSFLSGKMNAHIVPVGTESSTFCTIFIHPYFRSYGGFINTLVIFFFFIHSQASPERVSKGAKFVFPSLWISILAQANAKMSCESSIPNSWHDLILSASSVFTPPASFIMLHMAFTRNAPEPHVASRTLS